MNKYCVLILLVLMIQIGCVKDKPNPLDTSIPSMQHHGVLVCNEGSYSNNNAELSYIDIETNKIYNQIFNSANSKKLGDIAQDIKLMNGMYYIILNNSNKIVVIDLVTFQEKTSILSIQSPRYITQVSAQKAYVSSLYHNNIYVLNLQTNQIEKIINTDFPNTEHMSMVGNYCYVTNWDTASNYLYKVNTISDTIEKRIQLIGRASHDIVSDKLGRLWIISGNKFKNKLSYLYQFDPINDQILNSWMFHHESDPFRLTMNATKDTLYYISVNYNSSSLNNGLYKMSINALDIPGTPFIQAPTNSYYWAVGIDSSTQHIFLSDPKGFTQQSTISEFTLNGELIRQYSSGIGSNNFLFN